jgi:hypothetical protein
MEAADMDDPSSSDDDHEGWDDEFTTHIVPDELLPVGMEEGERGAELAELGAEDDWIDGAEYWTGYRPSRFEPSFTSLGSSSAAST